MSCEDKENKENKEAKVTVERKDIWDLKEIKDLPEVAKLNGLIEDMGLEGIHLSFGPDACDSTPAKLALEAIEMIESYRRGETTSLACEYEGEYDAELASAIMIGEDEGESGESGESE